MNQPDLVSVHRPFLRCSPRSRNSLHLPKFAISHGPGQETGNHLVETNIHGANQSGASCQTILRLILVFRLEWRVFRLKSDLCTTLI